MKMIDVREWKEGVQRRVDGRGYAVFAERGKRIVADHLVFVRFAAIDSFELLQAVEIQQGKAGILDRAEIAAAAFYGEDAHRLPGERIGKVDLRAGIAAAEIRDSQ